MQLDLTRAEADDLYDTLSLFLEFWAGTLDAHQIKVGDRAAFNLQVILNHLDVARLA